MKRILPYMAFANALREQILAGMYGWRGGLPGIKELESQSGLRANTIYRSLSVLVGERLLIQHSHGYYVNRSVYPMMQAVPPIAERSQREGFNGYIENVGVVELVDLPSYLAGRISASEELKAVHQVCVLGELINGNRQPTQFSHYWYVLPVDEAEIVLMDNDPSFDPTTKIPGDIIRSDEISSRQPVELEMEHMRVPSNMSVLTCFSISRAANTNEVISLEQDTFLPHIAFTYEYRFANRFVERSEQG